jgi:transposase
MEKTRKVTSMTPENALIHLRVENQVLREQLAQHIQCAQSLEERLAKDSHYSPLPPLSDRFARQPMSVRKQSEKKAGGQAGHPERSLSFLATLDESIVHAGQQVQPTAIEHRQAVEIPPTREPQTEQQQYPVCRRHSRASFLHRVHTAVRYRSRIGAIAVSLVPQQLWPWAGASEELEDPPGGEFCERTLPQQIKHATGQVKMLHQDETGPDVAAQRLWMHVTTMRKSVHYQAHARRSHDPREATRILPDSCGISVHDGSGSSFRCGCQHALCNVHLLRKPTCLAEEQGLRWAAKRKALLPDEEDQAHSSALASARQRGQVKQSAAGKLFWKTCVYLLLTTWPGALCAWSGDCARFMEYWYKNYG